MSDILIKDMEMPKSCYDFPLAMQDYTTLFGKKFKQTRNSYSCVLTHKTITSTKRNRFCPLIHVPKHGRLIDADALLNLLNNCIFPSDMVTTMAVRMATNWIKETPTILEAEGGE